MKFRFSFASSLSFAVLLGCSGTETSEAAAHAPVVRPGASPELVLAQLGSYPAFAEHLGKGGALTRRADGFHVERAAPAALITGGFMPPWCAYRSLGRNMPLRCGLWNCTASSKSRVSTGVDILQVADRWASAIDVHKGANPSRFLAEMKWIVANLRNGKRVSMERCTSSRW